MVGPGRYWHPSCSIPSFTSFLKILPAFYTHRSHTLSCSDGTEASHSVGHHKHPQHCLRCLLIYTFRRYDSTFHIPLQRLFFQSYLMCSAFLHHPHSSLTSAVQVVGPGQCWHPSSSVPSLLKSLHHSMPTSCIPVFYLITLRSLTQLDLTSILGITSDTF